MPSATRNLFEKRFLDFQKLLIKFVFNIFFSSCSIPDTIKDLLKKEKNVTDFQITKSVKKISGILNTDYDYKTLRSMCIAEKGTFFFHFVSSLSGPGGYEGVNGTV